ncbi:integrase core domain-containing protein [Streptomyces macrosporus]|uniref:integrase core domain-containing protein n=1 Tax=Streptomyces macrosporus TaxID=44032 RepID=UPI0031E07F36
MNSAPRAPKTNAHAARFVRGVRAERTDRMPLRNEHHARRVLAEYAGQDDSGRPHRAPRRRAPADAPDAVPFPARRIRRHAVLGGLVHECRDTP